MLSRIRANLTLKPLMDILVENGSKDLSQFESRHINGYIGYKFRSKSIGLPVEGIYEVTVTRDHFAYNIAAELGYEDALYILCISPDCKKIIGRFSIPKLNIYMEGTVSGKDANKFIQTFKLMYDRRERTTVKPNIVNNNDPIHNRYNLHKTTKNYSSNTASKKNNDNDSTHNKSNLHKTTKSCSSETIKPSVFSDCKIEENNEISEGHLTENEEKNIKNEILKMYSYRSIIIKDIKNDRTIGIDKRLNEISFARYNKTGKMVCMIIKKVNEKIRRRVEICFEDIVKITKYNSKFIIEVSEVMVYEF